MFTGIVDHVGKITRVENRGCSMRFTIETEFPQLVPGESIAVDGICLTVTEPTGNQFICDVSAETMAVTVASHYASGACVNMERALRAADRMGGHYVTGHVHQTAILRRRDDFVDEAGVASVRLLFGGILPTAMRYLTAKGSITVSGVSLTVNAIHSDGFEVMLIPHTLERTNLRDLKLDCRVNLEFDWMSKVIVDRIEALWEQRKTGEGQ